MKKTLTVMLLSLVMGAAAMTPAWAGRWGRGPESGWGPGCGGPCACRQVDDKQEQVRQDFRRQSLEQRQQLQDKKEAYRDLMRQPAPDKDEAAKLWSEIFDLQTKLQQMAAAAGVDPAARGQWQGDDEGPDCWGAKGCGQGPRGGCGRGCGGPR